MMIYIKRTATLLIVLLCLISLIHPIKALSERDLNLMDNVTYHMDRFLCLVDKLPENQSFGYLATNDGGNDIDLAPYFILNYTLAPITFANDSKLDWLVVNYENEETGLMNLDAIFHHGYQVIHNCKNGIFIIHLGSNR